jgi:hypothetical protein
MINGRSDVKTDDVVVRNRVSGNGVAAAGPVGQEVVRELNVDEMRILGRHMKALQRATAALHEAQAAASDAEKLVLHCDPTLALDLTRGVVVRNVVPVPPDA